MRKSSKIFWIALVVVAMLVVTTLGAMASGTTDAEIYGELVVGAEGAFSVNYKIKNVDTKVECGKITLNWDSESTEVVDVEYASILGTAEYAAKTGEAVIAWAGSEITEATPDGTTLFTVNFATEDEGVIPVTTTVDNFGTVGSFAIAYDCAEDVTANQVFASDNEVTNPTTLTVGVDGTIAEILEDAMNYAQSVNVVVDLNGETWTITEDGSLGSAESIPANTITIQNGTIKQNANIQAGSYWIFTTVMYGNFVFDDITLGAYTNSNNQVSEFGGFVFPEGCTGIFEDITQINALPNLYGNVTVKSGTYYMISGGFYANAGTRVGIGAVVNNPVIVIEGTTTANRVVGGTFKTNVLESVTGRATVTVQGGASVTGELVAGAMFRKGYSVGADLTVDTTGTVNTIISSAVAYGIAEEDMEIFTTTIKNAIVSTNVYGYRFNNTEASYVDVTTTIEGGTFNGDVYGGADASKAGASLHGTTALNITGGYFGTYQSQVAVYGGSNVTGANFDHNADSTVSISGGRYYKGVFGGSRLHAENAKHSGTSSVTVTGAPTMYTGNQYNNGNIFGGSNIESTYIGRVHSGDSFVTIGATDSRVNLSVAIYGGSFIQCRGVHEANSTVTINNAYLNNAHTGFYTYGGSSLGHASLESTGDVLHKGNSSVIINNATIREYSSADYPNYVFGGSEVNRAGTNTKHIGNSNITINGGEFGTSTIMMAGIFGGSNLVQGSVHQGNSTLTINDGMIYSRNVLAGSYGNGTIVGDSTFTMTGGTIYGNATDDPIGAGSFGKDSKITHTGNLTFNMQGGKIGTSNKGWVQVTGVNLTLDGDVTANISGGTIDSVTFLGRKAEADITGDLKVYMSAGKINYNLRGAGLASCEVGGNIFFECSGTIVGGSFQPVYVGTVAGKVYVKLVGNPTLPSSFMTDDNANSNSVLDLVYYTGTRTFTTSTRIDKIIYPFTNNTNVSFVDEKGSAVLFFQGQKAEDILATEGLYINATTNSSNAVNMLYADFIAFDEYTTYDNAFTIRSASDDSVIEALAKATTSVKLQLGNGTSRPAATLRNARVEYPDFAFKGASVTMEDNLLLNFKIRPELFAQGSGFTFTKATFLFDGVLTEYTALPTETDAEGLLVYHCTNISPRKIGEIVTAILYGVAEDGTELMFIQEYSVKIYAMNQISKIQSKNTLGTALVDLLNYGAAHQAYAKDTGDLVNADLTDAQKAWGTSTMPELEKTHNISNDQLEDSLEKVTWKGGGLAFEDSVVMRYKLQTADITGLVVKMMIGNDENNVVEVSYEEFQAVSGTTDQYYVYIRGLKSRQMREDLTLKVYDAEGNLVSETLTYSVEVYANNTYNKASTSQAIKDFLVAMIRFGDSAYNYVNS